MRYDRSPNLGMSKLLPASVKSELYMRLKKLPVAFAALALVSAPVVAQTTENTDTSTQGDENFNQGGMLALFAILALAIGIAAGGGGKNNPISA
jgi:hypothetical protein